MELIDLIEDLYVRFANSEKGQYAQIKKLHADIQSVKNNYNVLRTKRYTVGAQNTVIMIVGVLLMVLMTLFFASNNAIEEQIGNNGVKLISLIVLSIPIVAIIAAIVNTIRAKSKNAELKRKADEWWEQIGIKQIAQLNTSIESLKIEVSEYLNANPLYPYFQGIGWDNTRDCDRIHDIVARYNPNSIVDAFSIYNDILDREFEREQDRYRQQQILDAINENNQYQAELAAQGRRADFDRSIIELQLFEMKNRH